MNHQLALGLHLNYPSTLHDFFWGDNKLLQQQLNLSLYHGCERFLYLWGNSGSGKSHLLQGACQAMGREHKAAAFLPLMVLKEWGPQSIEGVEANALIAIDDIDEITGDAPWEEALFHLYNRVRDNGKTMLLIAGKQAPAAEAIQLADLKSRLGWGLVFQVTELNDELKRIALQERALKLGFKLSNKATDFLLNRSTRNMHDLYQVLDKLDEASLEAQRKVTVPFIKIVLGM